ncbi:sensor histidine kinase [Actinoplanes sp. LDG1-06]|uniref:histidine kinase n=1 Tax=Paractinoplanes ovalisporus TaxID=2810368 RepID=A0ABS2AVR1_9ACTN|nr:sensor histidine kinase [Actinoplanes ovalisporus]MBM2623815.1 sensor histidine kinase [Actinoplanes ovalisporus]
MSDDHDPPVRRSQVWLWRGALLLLIAALVAAELADELFVIPLIVISDVVVARVAATRPPRQAILAAVVALVVQVITTPGDEKSGALTWFAILTLLVGIACVSGIALRQRREHNADQREQAELRAVQGERLRIARELHDMIAHSFGVISVQAGMGRRIIDTQPEEARNALATIEETSRETAAALRRMLGSLRRSDPATGSQPRDPAPGLADLHNLASRAAQAGVGVDLRQEGVLPPLPPDVDLSAFRIIQEAVTNVIRHSGAEHCDVTLTCHGGDLTIEVTDTGRGGHPTFGYGLTGMRERVNLLRGQFEAGPRAAGGFRVLARIPLPALVPEVS